MNAAPLPIVVLISGRGSNLQAIIDAAQVDLPVVIRAVISNRPDALGLERGRRARIPVQVVDHKNFENRMGFDEALRAVIDGFNPGLVVLAGFMRILSPCFVSHYRGRLINIHPSLLPDFPGLNTHQRALEAGVSEHGASVHFVVDTVDEGPVIVQARVPVLTDDTEASLAERVLKQEHHIYPQAIRWFAEGRVELEGNVAMLDGKPALGRNAPKI